MGILTDIWLKLVSYLKEFLLKCKIVMADIKKKVKEVTEEIDEKFPKDERYVSDNIAYFIDTVRYLFKVATKGRDLSKQGANALILFFMTLFLLLDAVGIPSTKADLWKRYWLVPLGFAFYFIAVAGQNVERVRRFFRKIQQRSDVAFEDITENRLTSFEVQSVLSTIEFDIKQIKKIIKYLNKRGEFEYYEQVNLLLNPYIYKPDISRYLKKLLITDEIKWTASAVCIFLSQKQYNLNTDYLQTIFDKYKKYPCVLFSIGRCFDYQKSLLSDLKTEEKNYYLAGLNYNSNSKLAVKINEALYYLISLGPLSVVSIIYLNSTTPTIIIQLLVVITALFSLATINISSRTSIKKMIRKSAIKKTLKKYDSKMDKPIFNEFIGDIYYLDP